VRVAGAVPGGYTSEIVWAEAPAARVERRYAGPAVAADDEQLLARRSVPSRRIAVDATVAHIQAIDDGVPRAPALDDYNTVILQCV